jgi:adenylate cyclase
MSVSSEQRRLAAIMFTDMVGYSALAQRDQALAIELLEKHREILRSIFPRFNGTEIKTIGDAFLVEFQSALEAAQCAIEIQRTLAKRNHDVPSERRIEVRIGIHIGDVVHREGDVFGDGVNIASRIQPVAAIGGICISMDVERQIHNALEVTFEKLAPTELKNIQVPMDLFRIVLPWERDVRLKPKRQKREVRERPAIPLAWLVAAVLLPAAIGGWFLFGRYTASHKQTESAQLPAKSIAVLPFDNQNRDPDNDYLCDGIPESIINSLSELPKLKVMSRNSVFHYKGKETDAQRVGKELKVQTLLTGRVRQHGDSLTVGVELINAQDNSQMWGQQYNRKLADVFAVQEEIAKEVSEKLRLKLTAAEQQQLAKRPTQNLKAFQYYMQGRTFIQLRTREDLLTAVSYNERAIEEDGTYALAYAGLADVYANLGLRGYIAPLEGRRNAEEAARKALALDENLAEAHVAVSQIHVQFVPYNFSLGDRELRRAIELSPSLAMAHEYLGFSLLKQGRSDEGLAESLKARELDPLSSIIARQVSFCFHLKRAYGQALELLRQANELGPALTTQWEIGMYIQNGSYSEALAELEKAKQQRKDDPILIYSTGLVYAAQGKRTEALQIIKELEAMSGPNLDQAHWIAKIFAALNEKEMAFSWLERGLAAGAIGGFYKDEPVWDPIRYDPRFAALIGRMVAPETAPKP